MSALTRLDMDFQKPWPFKCQMVGQTQACMPVDVPFAAQKISYSTNVANDFFLRQRLHLRHQPALLFPPQRQLLGVGQLAGSLQARDEVGHFYPGGPGIATEEAKSKPELLDEGLGGGWGPGKHLLWASIAQKIGLHFHSSGKISKKKRTTIICFFLVTNYPHKTKWKKFACPPGHLGCIISWQIQLRSHTQDFALCSPTAGLESTWVENRTVGTPRLFDSAS